MLNQSALNIAARLNGGNSPSGMRDDPGDVKADDALADFEGALANDLRIVAKKCGVDLFLSPIVDATREEDGSVRAVVTLATVHTFQPEELSADEGTPAAWVSLSVDLAHLWSALK